LSCGKNFQSKRRKIRLQKVLWNKYVWKKQTIADLSKGHKKSEKWIRQQLDKIEVGKRIIKPQSIIVVVDTVFWGRGYGVTILREPNMKRNLWWREVISETPSNYAYGRYILEKQGFAVKAVVLDGKRGVRDVFGDVPIQMCHFHQIAIINRYLTRRPKLEASKELRVIALSLTVTTEKKFTRLLNEWYDKWQYFLKEKTVNPETHRWCYTHKRLRSACRSLKTNLPYLFTYQKYPRLQIPNTTNSLEGSFSHLKSLLRIHRGAKRKRRYKMICEILNK
jgi:hypothetical protein